MNTQLLPGLETPTLCSGYLTLDVVMHDGNVMHWAGGSAANVAANLAFLGGSTQIAGLIGTDKAGCKVKRDLRESGVGTAPLIQREDVETPMIIEEIRESGHRFHFRCPICGRRFAKYRPFPSNQIDLLVELVKECKVFYFDRANAATVRLAREFRATERLVVFEPSTRGHASLFDQAVEVANILKFSSERAHAFMSRLPRTSKNQLRIITDGANGTVVEFEDRSTEMPAFGVDAIDTCGAGDWTTTGILAGLGQTATEQLNFDEATEAVRFGQALAALSCAFPGARGMAKACSRTDVIRETSALLNRSRAGNMPSPKLCTSRRRRGECHACFATVSD